MPRPYQEIHATVRTLILGIWLSAVERVLPLLQESIIIVLPHGRIRKQLDETIMTTLQQAEQLISTLSRADKAQLLQWVVTDLGDSFPGIESKPDICGGEACIVRTRIPVWTLVQARRQGVGEAELLGIYPILTAGDLAEAWAYCRSHKDEIDRQIAENEAA